MRISRRVFLHSAALTLGMDVFSPTAVSKADRTSKRPYTWEDACARSDVDVLAISPDGATLAVQITRPLRAPGVHAGYIRHEIQPRAEIWLFDRRIEHPSRLDLGAVWAWAPCFSPQGSRIAALASKGDGKVGMVVWELAEKVPKAFLNFNVDLQTKFSSVRIAQPVLRGFPVPRQFAWLDEDTLVFVDHGAQPQFEEALAVPAATHADSLLRDRSLRGKTAVRVWNDTAPTCGAGRSLVRLNCRSGKSQTICRGDVRGVAVSPNRLRLAAVIASSHIRQRPGEPMPPEFGRGMLDDDPLVALRVAQIDLVQLTDVKFIEGPRAVGNVPTNRLPVWSDDSQRFALPTRESYSSAYATEDDACWVVSADSGAAHRWTASSALDAELLAALLTTAPADEIRPWIEGRPSLSKHAGEALPVGQVNGLVFKYGASNVAVWDPPTIKLIGPEGIKDVPGEFAIVYPPASTRGGMRVFATRAEGSGSGSLVTLGRLQSDVREVQFEADWTYLGTRATDGAVIAKQDSDSGTSIFAITPEEGRRVSSFTLNRHFKDVAKPQRRELLYRNASGDEFKGVLQLPIGHARSDRHPVVLWAYPDFTPGLNNSLTRINDWYALWLPFQYLLTRGFAVFHAPLPTGGRSFSEPIDEVTDAVLPWLDVLDKQPEVLPGEYGFFGHSDAGYVALALEAVTSRLKAIVACSTFPDLGPGALSSNIDTVTYACTGQLIQADRFYYEDGTQRYGLGAPFWQARDKFIRNSPLFRMDSASTPLLLIEGEFDREPRQMESLFSDLYGRGIPVELAYYWGEGHILSSPGNVRDMWERTEAFLGRYLKRMS